MVFRVNFLTFWIVCNIGFAIFVENYATLPLDKNKLQNDGSFGFLEIFSAFLTSLVLFRVGFGAFHIIKFKFLSYFFSSYKVFKFDMLDDAKQLKLASKNWNVSNLEYS